MCRRTPPTSAAASLLAAPAIAHPAKATTLRFVPQANLTALDPIFTTAIVTGNHGCYVFDTLYSCAMDGQPSQVRPSAETSCLSAICRPGSP